MKYLIILLALTGLACSDNAEFASAEESSTLTEEEARALSPIGEICVTGEITEIFVPANRGRGNNKGEWREIDGRSFEPAFLYGDVDYDGVAGTTQDARLAVKQIYIKQIESEPCPAVADIGTFPQGEGPDQFYTAEDIYQWNQVKHGNRTLAQDFLVCQSQCEIQNHMKFKNK